MARFALIIADPNNVDRNEIVSRHRTRDAAEKAMTRLSYIRWAYVAEQRADGSWPTRIEAEG